MSVYIAHAASHIHAQTGYVSGQLGCEEQSGSGHVFGSSHTSQGNFGICDSGEERFALAAIGIQLIPERSHDGAGLDAVYADAAGGKLRRQRTG